MAFPVIVSRTATGFTSDDTSHLVAMPAAVDKRDLLIIIFCTDGLESITTPNGWTLIHAEANGSACSTAAYVKVADGTEGGTTVDVVTGTSEQAAAHVFRITGARQTSNILDDVQEPSPSTGTSVNPDSPSSTIAGLSDILWISWAGNDNTIGHTVAPTDYNDPASTGASGSGGATVHSAWRNNRSVTEDPGAWTIGSSAAWIGNTISVRPAGSGGSGGGGKGGGGGQGGGGGGSGGGGAPPGQIRKMAFLGARRRARPGLVRIF